MAPPHAAITALGATAAVGVLNVGTIRDAGTALRWLVETTRQRGSVVNPSTLGRWLDLMLAGRDNRDLELTSPALRGLVDRILRQNRNREDTSRR